MYRLEVRQLVIVRVDARAEEESCVPPVDDFVLAELDEVGLIFLVAGGYETVHLGREGKGVSLLLKKRA